MSDLINIPPEKRDLAFGGALQIISVEQQGGGYSIHAHLPRTLDICPVCGHQPLAATGNYQFRVADIPYVGPTNRVVPVKYHVSAKRFVCRSCNKISVEPRPFVLNPVVTGALLTRRMSEWLIELLRTPTPYSVLAPMSGYSAIWLRKWYVDVRKEMDLPPKGRGSRHSNQVVHFKGLTRTNGS